MRYAAYATTRILGIALMILGVVGLFLPFLQGIFFLLVGLYLFSFSSPKLRERVHKWIAPYPKIAAACQSMDNGIKRLFRLE